MVILKYLQFSKSLRASNNEHGIICAQKNQCKKGPITPSLVHRKPFSCLTKILRTHGIKDIIITFSRFKWKTYVSFMFYGTLYHA